MLKMPAAQDEAGGHACNEHGAAMRECEWLCYLATLSLRRACGLAGVPKMPGAQDEAGGHACNEHGAANRKCEWFCYLAILSL